MEVFDTGAVVIGAGVLGLAIARELALAGHEPLILERNDGIGQETSARNSEVIHAGIYYPSGSAKARHCVRGRDLLLRYARSRSVPYRQCGKLIVAADHSEITALESITHHAAENGVALSMLAQDQALRLEPELHCEGALLSPLTGIIDSHAFMLSLLGEAEDAGAQLVLKTDVKCGTVLPDGRFEIEIGGEAPVLLHTPLLINAAGLNASRVASSIEGVPMPPRLSYVKGNYFSYSGSSPFSHLIYPVPREGGLGVHLTLDLAGRARFGPDTEWLEETEPDQINYTVDASRAVQFETAIRSYWPRLPSGLLAPDYSGVRPKIAGEAYPDFEIVTPDISDVLGYAGLYGIESPGLTAALSIAEEVVSKIGG